MVDALIESWWIHHRINLYLLDAIPPEALEDRISQGRTVAAQFGHIHNVRFQWIKAAAPSCPLGLEKLDLQQALSHQQLQTALDQSATAMASRLTSALEGGKFTVFKPHPQAFLAYLISHESHHRGQILTTLKLHQHLPDQEIRWGIWDWKKHSEASSVQ
ncbi:MAG: DinB family protein [Bacteroidota bacterium]